MQAPHTNKEYKAIMFPFVIAYNWLTFFQHDDSLWLRKLVATLEIKQQIATQSTPSLKTYCKYLNKSRIKKKLEKF